MDGDAAFNCTLHGAISSSCPGSQRDYDLGLEEWKEMREGSATEKHGHAKGRRVRLEFNGRSGKSATGKYDSVSKPMHKVSLDHQELAHLNPAMHY